MTQKTRTIIGWVLTALLAIVFLGSAAMKLSGGEGVVKSAASMGISANNFKLIAVIEIISVLLFIIPQTAVLGALLLAAYIGGAIATHVEHQIPITPPLIIECLIFIAAAVRLPELTKRILGHKMLLKMMKERFYKFFY